MNLEQIRRRLAELRARVAEVLEEMRTISEADEPDADQEARFDELVRELEDTDDDGTVRGLHAEIEQLERREAVLVRAQDATSRGLEHGDDRGVPNHNRQDDPFDLNTLRVSPFDDRDTVNRQLVGRAQTAIEQIDASDDVRERMTNLLREVDDSGALARRIITCGSERYERAFANYLAGRPAAGDEARALSVGTGSEGGYAVPVQLDPTIILTSDGSVNPLRQIARVETITTKEWQGVTSAGVTVSYATEAAQAGDDAPTLAQVTVTPERAHAFIPFSYEVDQDWTQLRTEMARMIAEGRDDLEADKFVTGSGSDEPEGVVAGLAAASKVNTASDGTFASSDVYKLETELPDRFRPRGRFVAHKKVYSDVRQFASSDGHDLWERIGAGQPPLLLGYPAHESSAMDSDSTSNGDEILLFGDFRHYLIVDRAGMSVELVPHVFGGNQRPTGQRGIYAFWRNSAVVLADNAFRLLVVAGS